MPELLLELFSEEIPARMQLRAAEDLRRLAVEKLTAAKLAHNGARTFVTPRRLTLVVDGLPARQPDIVEEKKGPRVGAPEEAIKGFLRSAALNSIEQCEKRLIGKNEFWFAVTAIRGLPTDRALVEVLQETIDGMSWPKSMRWGTNTFRWVRPLHNILAIFDGQPIALEFDLRRDDPNIVLQISEEHTLVANNCSRGHRFLAPAEFIVSNFADYAEKLRAGYVLLDPAARRQKIADDLALMAKGEGLRLKDDPGLLDEVAGLVEFPVVLAGTIEPEFMDLPHEVLTTSMRAHQKYFALLDAQGALAAKFLVVANNLTEDGGATIVAGNQRVLRARLSDAKFFWDQDRKVKLEARVPKLAERIFHARLGSVLDKVARVERLVDAIAPHVEGADTALAKRAARLAKADLSTGMVGEFPELQGAMGRYYALHDGEKLEVADAVAEHYSPLGPNDRCPTAPTSVVVALADKIDTLVGFFAIGEKPTGSRDPYALRRAALGAIRLILENRIRFGLARTFKNTFDIIHPPGLPLFDLENSKARISTDIEPVPENTEASRTLIRSFVRDELLAFFADRLKVHLREQGVRHDLIAAVFAPRIAASRNPLPTGEGRVRADAAPQSAPTQHDGNSPNPLPRGEGTVGEGTEGEGIEVEDDLVRLLARVAALDAFLKSEDGANLLTAYRRASNIVRIEEKKDGRSYDEAPDPSQMREAAEAALAERLVDVERLSSAALRNEEFGVAMAALARLRRPVDEFFNQVTVNSEDAGLRINRLRLLSQIRATLNQVADFAQIEG
jgi:glycyl-tRNA synthetase beta chain